MTQKEALDILKTGANVFLTGEPGAGKTHTINQYVNYLRDADVEVAITASTGIAATHIGGMTIHSWSGIGIKNKLDKYDLIFIEGQFRYKPVLDKYAKFISENNFDSLLFQFELSLDKMRKRDAELRNTKSEDIEEVKRIFEYDGGVYEKCIY